MPISGDWTYEPGTTPPPPSAPDWQLPPALSPDARRTAGANLLVYVLNPNARNPDVAMAYLEYLCGHRALYDEALLKPASASPVLHPQIEEWIAWIIEDQHALDAEQGLETDEEALAARTDAIRAAPDSWAVTQGPAGGLPRENRSLCGTCACTRCWPGRRGGTAACTPACSGPYATMWRAEPRWRTASRGWRPSPPPSRPFLDKAQARRYNLLNDG